MPDDEDTCLVGFCAQCGAALSEANAGWMATVNLCPDTLFIGDDDFPIAPRAIVEVDVAFDWCNTVLLRALALPRCRPPGQPPTAMKLYASTACPLCRGTALHLGDGHARVPPVQHGENPEHSRVFDDPPRQAVRLAGWLESIHFRHMSAPVV